MTFNELGVRDDLLRGITDMGFETPMPVQEKVIPVLLKDNHDLVALAQTGTGKPPHSVFRCSSALTLTTNGHKP